MEFQTNDHATHLGSCSHAAAQLEMFCVLWPRSLLPGTFQQRKSLPGRSHPTSGPISCGGGGIKLSAAESLLGVADSIPLLAATVTPVAFWASGRPLAARRHHACSSGWGSCVSDPVREDYTVAGTRCGLRPLGYNTRDMGAHMALATLRVSQGEYCLGAEQKITLLPLGHRREKTKITLLSLGHRRNKSEDNFSPQRI